MLGAWLVLLVGLAGPAAAADWYVDPSGHDTNNTCQTAASPCRTIQAAIDKAGVNDTVYVAGGNYPFTSNRIKIEGPGKNGLRLIGQTSPFALPYAENPVAGSSVAYGTLNNKAANAVVLQQASANPASGNAKGMIWVRGAQDVRIENLYIEIHGSRAKEGVLATGNVNGLTLINNYLKVTSGSGSIPIGITVRGTADSSSPEPDASRGSGNFVHIEGNVIEPSASSTAAPKRAIAMQNAVGVIVGNQVAATTQDMWIQSPTVVNGNPAAQKVLKVEDNWFFGRLQLYLPAASNIVEPVAIRNNHFIAPGSSFSPSGSSSVISGALGNGSEAHSVRVMASQTQPTIIEGNEFKGFGRTPCGFLGCTLTPPGGHYRALWIMSRAGVIVQDNVFTPEPGQTDFTAVLVGNRQVWNGLPDPTPYGVTFLRNTFHANGATGGSNNKTKAILFLNDNDPSGAAPGGTLQIGDGTLANANHFDADIRWYVALDDRTCPTANNHNSGTNSGCRGASSTPHVLGEAVAYSGGSNASSYKRPFRWDVNAPGNVYGGVFMDDMDQTQFDAVKAKTFADHNKVVADADVGDVLLGWTPPLPPPSVELDIGVDPGNSHKTGEFQAFTLAAKNTGGPGLVRGRIIVSRADGAPIPQRPTGDGSDDTADSLLVMTGFGLTDLVRSVDGNSVSLVWPPVDVTLDEEASLPPQDIGVLFRVPGEYNVLAEIFDAIEPTTVYGSESFTYAVTQDLDVTITGDNPTGYTGSAQPLAFYVTPASNPAVSDLASKVALAYNGSPAAPVSVGTYAVTATTADADYVPQLEATNYTIGGATAVRRLRDGVYFASVEDALADAGHQDGDTLEMAPGTYSGPIVLNKPVKLVGSVAFTTMTAGPDPMPTTIIDGGAAAGHGITVPANVEGVSIENLEVRNFGGDCIHAAGRNHGLEVSSNYVHHCNLISGRGGIYVNGSVAGVTIQNNRVHNASRGIILWNGVKADITVHNNHVHGPGTPSGILLNDGTATGVHITDNLVENTEDTGIALQQLTSGSPSDRANVIGGNQVINPGRLGISLQVPNGTGAETGDGAILVENNEVSGRSASLPTIPTGMGAFPDDRAGISIVRRFFSASEGQIDVTRGVLIRNNTVRDFIDANPMREAYGIVVEGLGSTVAGNVLENNQFGLQIQQGNDGYPGDAPVGAPSDDSDWFDRGNAPLTCVSLGQGADENTFFGNGTDERYVPAGEPMVGARVLNQDTLARYCSINAAIAAASEGDTLVVDPGIYVERVNVNKGITLLGAQAGTPAGSARSSDPAVASIILPPEAAPGMAYDMLATRSVMNIFADNATVDGFVLDGDNPDLSTGLPMGAADPDVDTGVFASGSNIHFVNNEVRNLVYAGFYGYNSASATPAREGNIVAHNWIHNLDAPSQFGVGIGVLWNYYADIHDNLVTDARVGIQTNYFFKTAPVPADARIAENTVRASSVGIYHNYHVNDSSQPSPFTISGNDVGAVHNDDAVGPWAGIHIQQLGSASTAIVEDNQVDGSALAASGRLRLGYAGSLLRSSIPLEIRDGTVNGVDYGVLASDGGYYTGPVNDLVVRDMVFTDVAQAALVAEDTALAGTESTDHGVQISVGTGNDYDVDMPYQGMLAGPKASIQFQAGATRLETVLVRADGHGYRGTEPDSTGNVRMVEPASINAGIAAAANDGQVHVEAGTFEQTVLINRPVRLLGAQAGVDASSAVTERSGGETIIAPDAPVRVSIPPAGSGSVLDGFTITGTSSTTSVPVAAISTTATDVVVRNNRIVSLTGNGVYLSNSLTQNIVVEQNRFAELTGGSYNGVKTEASNNLSVVGNSFSNIDYQGIQLGGTNSNAQVIGNRFEQIVHGGINIGGGSGITVSGNELFSADTDGGPTRAAIRIYGAVGANVACNTIDASNQRGIYFHSSGGAHVANVFHNAISAPVALVNDHGGSTVVGSNWYGGAAPSTAGGGAPLLVAQALAADPIGNAACGINTAHSIVAYGGTGTQSTPVDTAFTDLRARVQDELGGAVMGVEVTFSDPSSSTAAGATLGTLVGNTDFNGELVTTAVANSFAGSYTVSAGSGSLLPASFALTNTQGTATVTVSDVTTVYNGTPHAVSVSTDPAGLEADVQIVYTDASSAVVATCAATAAGCGPVNAGTYTATATIVGNANYAGSGSGTLTISRAATSIVFDTLSFEYNAGTHAVSAHLADEPGTACTVSGTVGPDVAGSPYAVTASACTGINYEAPAATASAEVTPQSTTISFDHLVQAYDGAPKSVSVTTSPTAGVAVSLTYDGSPTPPSAVGSYLVEAETSDPNFIGSASATMEIVDGAGDIALVLSGPVDPVPVGELAHYAATMIANPALHVGETFGYQVVLAKSGGSPLAISDIATMEVFYQGNWVNPAHFGMDPDDLFSFDIDGNLVYQFPDGIPGYAAGFEIDEPLWTWNFRFSFSSPGVYTTSAQLVDGVTKVEISPPVLASIATVVVDELPPTDLHLVLSGPSGAVEAGQLVEYAATLLADSDLHSGDRFNIVLRMQKTGGAPLTVADLAEVQVFDGTFWHVYPPSIVFDEVGGELVYVFPDASGFPITSDSTQTHVRVVYANTGVYTLTGALIDNADYADPDLAYVHSTAAVSTTVVDATVVIPEMHLLLSGPLDPVELGDTAQYTGTMIANPADFAGRNFFVRIRLAKNGGADAMSAADLAVMELFDGSQWHDATADLQAYLMPDGNELVYLFPRPAMDAGFPITSPVWSWNFRFTYGDTGVFSAVADVVDAADIADIEDLAQVAAAAALATASVETTVVETPQIVIDMQGPVVGEVGQPLQYIGSLDVDPLPASSDTYYVAIRLSKNGGADVLTEADLAAMEISLDGGVSWNDYTGMLPLIQDDNYLTYDFPQPLMPGGFPITGPWSWDFRFTYASEGVYRAEAVVVTADTERTPVSNTATVQTTIFAQTPEIAIALQGPVSGIGVGDAAHYTGTLTADPLPDAAEQFIVRVRLGKNGGSVPMTTADLVSMAISADGTNWTDAPEVLGEIHPDPADNNYLLYDFPNPAMSSFPITGPWTWHFQFVYGSEGTYSAEATVLRYSSEEVASNTAGVATLVGPGNAHVTIDPASLYVVYDGNPKAAAVVTTPAGLDVTVTYDGVSVSPTNAGTYLVEAVIDAGQGYSGTASATLVIAKRSGTVSFTGPLSGSFGSVHAVSADILEEPGSSCTLSGVPASADPVGTYLVTASCEGVNHSAHGSTLYEVTAGAGVSIEAVDAAAVGVVTVDPMPDADAKKSYYSWRTHGAAGEFVKGAFSISSGAASPQAGDLQIEYLEVQTNTWMTLPLSFDAGSGVWNGEFGPGSGFPLVDGATSQFRATFHKGGRYTTTASVVGVSGLVYAISTPVVTDVAQVRLSGVSNAAGRVGEPIESSLTMANSGTAALSSISIPGVVEAQPAPNNENVRGRFVIHWDGGALQPADPNAPGGNGSNCGVESCASPDVAIEYFDPALGQYRPIFNLRQSDDGQGVYGHFGSLVGGGTPVWAGFDASTLFRTTFKQYTGTYTVTWQVVGLETGTVYAEGVPQVIGIDEGQGAYISIVSGDAGEAVVGGNGYDLGDLVVEVRNIYNNPVPGAAVTFNVLPGVDGAGATLSAPQVTDADGRTSVTAMSNDVAGDFEVSASLSNGATLVHPFVLGNLADADPEQVQLVTVSGGNQTAQVGTAYGLPLVVKVTDRFGNALQGVDVTFAMPASGASVVPGNIVTTTGADGLADSGTLTANAVAGEVAIDVSIAAAHCDSVSADAVCAVAMSLTNTAGGADSLTLSSSADQAEAGSAGAYTLTATVFDTDANPVPGISVTLIGPNAGAGITPAVFSAITDADGQVVQTFDANTTAGEFQVQAVVSGVSPATVELENLAGAAAKIALVSGDGQSAAVGSAFAEALVVQVLDQYDNPVADDEAAVVGFTSVDNGVDDAGADVPATATSAADGLASVNATANAHVGSYSVVASFNGHDVGFTLANTTGAVTISDIVWADSGTATVAYDGSAKAATATVAGSSVTPVFTYNGHASAPVDAGTYLVTATVDDGNVFGSASAMLTIEPAAAGNTGIDLTGGSFVYDGVAKPATVTNPDGVGYTLAYDTANGLAPVNAGSYTATLTVTDPNHAADTLTATIEITPAPVELVFGSLSHVYDGTAKSAAVTTTPAGVTGVSLSYSPDAAPTNAGTYEVEATLSNPNYALTGTTTAQLVIEKATAQIFLSNLTQVYDGTQKVVTVTTVPAALAADVVVGYTPAVPVNVGSYAVEAVLDDHPNYEAAPANGTLTIIAATIAGFEIVGDDSFSGVAGEALNGALPTVRVFDTSGQGVMGISIDFAVTAGNGSIEGAAGIAVTTDADGQATVPEWVLGAVAGVNSMTAATGLAGLPELEFTAIGEQVAQLSIDKTVNLAQAHAGQVLDYSIVVANDGPSTVQATLLDAMPDGLESISWICLAEDGAVCGETSGNGDIEFDSMIPAGGSITVTVSGTVAADATTGQLMVNTAVVTWQSEGQEQEAEDSASTNIVPAESGPCSIFCDGFEDVNLGKRLALPGAADKAAVRGWDLAGGLAGRPQLAVELVGGDGQAVAWLDSLKVGEQRLLRLRSLDAQGKQRAGAWQAWPEAAAVSYGWELGLDGLRLDFAPAGAKSGALLQLQLPAGAAIPERARTHAATSH